MSSTQADVESFRDSFNFVDVDLSGMINMEEWFLFLGRMNQKLSPIESQLLFLHIDKDRDGEITMRELLAIVFQKATAKQLNTMHRHLWDLHLRDATERKQRDIENRHSSEYKKVEEMWIALLKTSQHPLHGRGSKEEDKI